MAYAVAVRDIGATADHLVAHDAPFRELAGGRLAVPSTAALGCAVVFQQHEGAAGE